MVESVDLTWPWCLGMFDEESCRYFLHEVGSRLVPRYPFSFGIEEVYGILLDTYGFDGTPDVTSLLQELLEDKQNADGLGDDGDVWRSWRHGWRHRNDNVRNPFVPRFGSLVLRQSTPPRIRLLKAMNFVQQHDIQDPNGTKEIRNKAAEWAILEPEHDYKDVIRYPRNCSTDVAGVYPQNRLRAINGLHDDRDGQADVGFLDEDVEQEESRHKRSSSIVTANPTLSTLFDMLEQRHAPSTQLRGGERVDGHSILAETKIFERLSGLPSSVDRNHKSGDLNLSTADGTLHTSSLYADNNLIDTPEKVPRGSVSHGDTEVQQGSEATSDREPGEEPVIDEVARVTGTSESNNPQSRFASEDERRAENRQARLIDGTIFTSRSRRSKTDEKHSSSQPIPVVASKKTSARLSWSPGKRRDSLRSNWTHEIRQFFHRDKLGKPSIASHKHRSVPAPNKSCALRHQTSMSIPTNSHPSRPSKDAPRRNRKPFGLDGTSERPPSSSPLNLNKPLPLSPDDIVRSMSSRSQLTSSQYSQNTSNLPSATSTASSLSRTSSKKEFRGATRELFQSEMLSNHELPPIREVETGSKDCVDPVKSPVLPPSPGWYKGLAQGNPYIERSPPRSPHRPPPLDLSGLGHGTQPYVIDPPIPQPNQSIDNAPLQQVQSSNYFSSLPWSKSSHDNQHTEVAQSDRGRTRPVLVSPKNIQKETLPPKTPTKRSRSPIKRFLGLTKSNSTNKLEDHETPAPPMTPGTSKKDSLKKWGDKLRYGFLTPDQEQLRQEELIEAHNHDSATSTPQNSSFPISLEPPVQAKIQSEVELIITVTANRYLMREARAGRISPESVAKVKELWEKMNRPQVVEFHYDQLTQHNLIMANLDRVKLHGDAATDAIAINSTMRGWKTMAREMSIRTFCSPDSVIRKHLHDAHRVLELIGAPLVTFMAYEDMQLKTLSKINQRQKERLDRRTGSAGRDASTSSNAIATAALHRRNASEGSYQQQQHDYSDYPITALQMDKISLSPSPTPLSRTKVRKATGAEGAIMSLPTNFERSRDGYAANLGAVKKGKTFKEI